VNDKQTRAVTRRVYNSGKNCIPNESIQSYAIPTKLCIFLFSDNMYLHYFIDKMFPVQILVVLSTMIILNQAATLKYENLKSVTPSYEDIKEAYEMINDKKNNNPDMAPSYDFDTTDSNGIITNYDETAARKLSMVKSFPIPLIFLPIIAELGMQAYKMVKENNKK